jgi:dTDP-4-dehydrorhamnose 3,5-epimerase
MIEGVIITPLKQIFDERGKVMHMLRKDSEIFTEFGEIYFSCTNPGAVKAWHLHKKMTLNYAVINGQIKCVLYDDRPESSTYGCVEEIFMSTENYFLVTVPPLVWNGFKGIGMVPSIVANCASIPHDPSEIIRKPSFDKSIPYDWGIKHK